MKKQIFIFALLLALVACNKEENDPTRITKRFDYKTIQQFALSIDVKSSSDVLLRSVPLKLYTIQPFDENGMLRADHESYLLYKGATNSNGRMDCQLAPASTVDTLYVVAEYIGVPNLTVLPISDKATIELLIGGKVKQSSKVMASQMQGVVSLPDPTIGPHGFYTLGRWNANGLPDYLMSEVDLVSVELLEDLNLTLPERQSVPKTYPNLVEQSREGSMPLTEDAEVFVTFISEGATYLNVVGYYTYPSDTPPATVSAIKDKTLIFPNASLSGSGGSLVPGNKVQLLYLDPVSKKFTTVFPAGITVGWIIVSNGFTGLGGAPRDSRVFYSNSYLNPEVDPLHKKHNLVFNDSRKTKLIVAWEDQRRDQTTDDDFNDLLYYATVTPVTAVDPDLYNSLLTVRRDADGDGVEDDLDEFPNDPKRAFANIYPSVGSTGTLAFEDLWPSRGDYDFNDLVLEYQYTLTTNGSNQVTDLDATFVVKAVGASYHNGFALQLNTPSANVKKVSGQHLTEDYIKLLQSGAEAGQSKATIVVFDDVWTLMAYGNTVPEETYAEPAELKVSIEFETPVDPILFGPPPYNPFIILNRDRSKEVHLPLGAPTDLADMTYFETADDRSVSSGFYYTSSDFLPWALNFPVSFDYPVEKANIADAYLFFVPWAASQGKRQPDWYLNKEGYRVDEKIYKKGDL